MALTTRAIVLQRLGLTDDAAVSGAISVGRKTATTATVATTATALTVSINGGATTSYTLTDAANDTLAELIAVVNAAHTEIELEIVTGLASTTASSLLDASQSIALSTSNGTGVLTYTNAATGTVAALIDNLITEADYGIARYCNRQNESTGAEEFSSQTHDEYYDGPGDPRLQLRGYPVSAVSSVTLVGVDGTATSTLTSGSDYQIDSANGRLKWVSDDDGWPESASWDGASGPATMRVKTGWPVGFRNIRVQYTAGYATIPYDLRSAATSIVADMYLNRKRNLQASSVNLSGIASTTFADAEELCARYHSLLSHHRRVTL